MVVLLFLESLIVELERSAVLVDRAHDVLGGAVRDLGFYLQRHSHVGAHQSGEMRNHLIGDLAGVTADAGGVEGNGAVKAL